MQSPFMRADEVAEILEIAKCTAYIIIRKLNAELNEKGYLTQSGRVSRSYFYERTGLTKGE